MKRNDCIIELKANVLQKNNSYNPIAKAPQSRDIPP